MPTNFRIQPTGQGAGENTTGKTRTKRWGVAGLLTPDEALNDPDFPVAFNDAYEVGSKLKAESIRVDATGFRVQTITANYSIPEDGEEHEPPVEDVTQPVVYNWQTVQEGVGVDRDADGNAMVTTSRRAVPGLTSTKNYKRVTITRWENSYDIDESLAYENTVNAGPFLGAAAGEVKCSIIQPNQSITLASSLIGIDRVFDFKAVKTWGEKPWWKWFANVDSFAFATIDSATKLVRIVTLAGQSVSNVPLDASGVPLDSDLTYIETLGGLPVDSPSWVPQSLPSGAEAVTQGDLVFLRFKEFPEKNFAVFGF